MNLQKDDEKMVLTNHSEGEMKMSWKRAAIGPAKRATTLLVLWLAITVMGAAWVTDGFTKAPDWRHWRSWQNIDRGYSTGDSN